MVERLGEARIDLLRERREDNNYAKGVRKGLKDVTKHYRDEFRRIEQLRANGEIGRIEVTPY